MMWSKFANMDGDMKQQVTLTLLGIVGATYVLYRLLRRSDKTYPPGPSTLPVLGNLHQVALCGSMIKFLERNRNIYGNIYTVELGGVKRVVVSGYDVMKELFEKSADYTSNRTTLSMPETYTEAAQEKPGLFWAKFPHWKTIRSFALSQLREEGMGKSSLEPRIMEELHRYLDHFITPSLGQPIDLHESLNLATANVISVLVRGKRHDYTDENFLSWKRAVDEAVDADTRAAICRNIPLAKYLPGDLAGIKASRRLANFMIESTGEWVEESKGQLDPDNPVGFLDHFLMHSQKLRDNGEEISVFTDGNAAIASLQLFGAGLETTATALRWALLYMCVYPDIQEKVRSEIDRVIGQKEVTYKDRLSMPYIEAVTQEVFRRSLIAPTAIPHQADKDLEVEGKIIPAGSELMLNMASVLHDETVYEEPDKFNPERFLSGDVEMKKAHNLAFGLGRRVCLGRDLAKMEFFLFFVSILQRYKVTCVGDEVPSLEGLALIVNAPRPYKLIISSRA